jgi:hypothetical protein
VSQRAKKWDVWYLGPQWGRSAPWDLKFDKSISQLIEKAISSDADGMK